MTQPTDQERAEFDDWWREYGLGDYDTQFEAWQASRRAQVVPKQSLVWTEPASPCEACRYDHVIAQGPLGPFRIEWKSWKEHDDYCLFLNGDFVEEFSSLEEAKSGATEHLRSIAACLLPFSAAPQPPVAAPVQMPESISKVLEDCRSRAIDYATCPSPYNNTRMETAFQSLEHQVRQLLTAKLSAPSVDTIGVMPEPRWYSPSPGDAAHFPYYTPEDVRQLLASKPTEKGE